MIDTYYAVRCDRCGRQAETTRAEQSALVVAAHVGYALNVDDRGRDLCPTCAKEVLDV